LITNHLGKRYIAVKTSDNRWNICNFLKWSFEQSDLDLIDEAIDTVKKRIKVAKELNSQVP